MARPKNDNVQINISSVPGMAHVLEVETYLQPRVVTPKA